MEKVAIIGAGTMGHSIALSIALERIPVTLYGVDENDISKAKKAINEKLDVFIKYDVIQEEEKKKYIDFILTSTNLKEAVKDASMVIEAAPEVLDFKQDLFEKLEAYTDKETILASNSSSLLPSKIAALLEKKDRVLGLHFWNPAHLVPLVEIIKSEATSEKYVARVQTFLQVIRKEAILVEKEVLGFIGNRLQFALLREAQHLYEHGVASIEDIDKAVELSLGRRLSITGPFASADLGGLDIFKNISNYTFEDLSKRETSADCINKLVEEEKLGLKSGTGYYDWSEPSVHEKIQQREEELIRWLKHDLAP